MFNFKANKKLAVVICLFVIGIVVGLAFFLSTRCKFSFENTCLSTSNFWQDLRVGEVRKIFTDNTIQTIDLESITQLKLSISFTEKEYPKRNEAIQYREVSKKDLVDSSDESFSFKNISIGNNANLIMYCYKGDFYACNLFEEPTTGNSKEKTLNLSNRAYSTISIIKPTKIVQSDIDEIESVLVNIYTGPK